MNTLSAFAALAPATPAATPSTPTSTARGEGQRQEFGTLLKSTPAAEASPAPSPAATAADQRSASSNGAAAQPATEAEDAAATESSTLAAATDEGDDALGADDSDTEDTWPPAGLAGLGFALPASPSQPLAASAAASPNAAGTGPAAMGAPAPAVNPMTLQQGTAAAIATASPADVASQLAVSTDAGTPDAELQFQQLLQGAAGDAEGTQADTGTAPALLHALSGVGETRATGLASLAAVAAPTATPDVHAEDFGDAFGARLSWMADQKIGHAHIRVTPNDLGAIEVRLQLDGDRVHASFSSANAEVRQALESSLPRLREMLGEHGMELAHADVGQGDTPQSGDPHDGQGTGLAAGPATGAGSDAAGPASVTVRGLLDTYA